MAGVLAAKQHRPTAKAVAAQLTADVAALWSLIRDHQIYVDTAIFLLDQPVMPSIRKVLRDTNCDSIAYFGSRAMQYGHRIEVQRPTKDTLIRLAKLLPGHIVSGLHVAVDFTTASQENAETLARELSLHDDVALARPQQNRPELRHNSRSRPKSEADRYSSARRAAISRSTRAGPSRTLKLVMPVQCARGAAFAQRRPA